MSSPELDNLVRTGMLKREPAGEKELEGLRLSAERRLVDSERKELAGAPAPLWRVLAKAHERRNAVEYRGYIEHDERLLAELISATRSLREMIK